MARRRKTLASLSQEQAHQALTFLVHEGKLALGTVERALKNRERIIREIRERMAALGAEGMKVAGRVGAQAAAGLRQAESASRKPRRKAVSAAVKASRRAQGRYLGAIRQLPKSARKKIKAIREKSGVNAAIAAAKKMAR